MNTVLKKIEESLNNIERIYEKEIFVDAKISFPAFESLVKIIKDNPSEKPRILKIVNEISDRFLRLRTAGEYRFAAEFSEYYLKHVGWVEFFEHLEVIHSKTVDPSIRMSIEIAIKRAYNPKWAKGDYPNADFGESLDIER